MKRDVILDAWRGIAILMVLVHHVVYFHYGFFRDYASQHVVGFWSTMFWRLDQLLVAFAERSGPLGVKVFFVVSGYIITRLMLEEEAKRGSVSLAAFYARRAFRILPPYLLYMLCLAVFASFGWIALTSSDFSGAFFFICNTGASCGWFVVHTWSLATEMQFYLVWPVVFVLLPARWRVGFLIICISVFLTLSALELFMPHNWIDNGASFACIALGALYATSAGARAYVERWGIRTLVFGACALGLLVFAKEHVLAHFVYRALMVLSLPIIIFSAYRVLALARSRIVQTLSYLGLVSYSLYLWQEVFAAEPGSYLAPSLLTYAPLMLVFCLFSYFVVEQPAIALGKRLLKRRTASLATEQEALGI